MKKMHWPLVLVLGFTLLALYASNTILGTLVPSIASEIPLTPIEKGAILAGYGYTYAAMQIPVGFISDRYEPKKIITFSMTVLFLITFFFSLSANVVQLIVGRLAMGVAASFLYVEGLKTIEVFYGRSERGRAIGVFTALAYTGVTTSNLYAQFFLQTVNVGWRLIYQTTSLIVLSSTVLCFLYLPHTKLPVQDTYNHGEKLNGSGWTYSQEFLLVAKNKFFWIHTMVSFVFFGSLFAIFFWFPTYFSAEGFGAVFGSVATALVGIGCAVGSAIGGLLADKLRDRLPIVRATIVSYAVLLSLISFLFVAPRFGILILVSCFGIGLSEGGVMPNTRIIAELFPKEVVGTAFGIFNTLNWLGSATYPFIVGIALNFGLGFDISFLVIILSLVAVLVTTISSFETGGLTEQVLDQKS